MNKGRKNFRKKKGLIKRSTKKNRKADKDKIVNKKALFNRYKNAQKVEEAIEKKRHLEQKLKKYPIRYLEDEEEELTPYELLLASFGKTKKYVADTDDESSNDEEMKDVAMKESESNSKNEDELVSTDEDSGNSNDNSEISMLQDMEAEDENGENDPFTTHLRYDLSDELVVSLSNTEPPIESTDLLWPTLGNLYVEIPKPIETLSKKVKPKITLLEDETYAETGRVPTRIEKVDFKQLWIKPQIRGNIVSANKTNLIKRDLELKDIFTPLQKELFSIFNNYQDLYYSQRTFTNADEIRFTYCLHIVNHMLKTRTKIIHHNAKLAKKNDLSEDYRDQGLVRPKVVIMVPFKDAAYRVVKTLIDILVPKEAGEVVNKKRFEEDFTGGELIMPKKNPKPEDYELMFSGNTDDNFRLGMTVTKKTLKLYTDFYSSDIIVVSPLGLRMIVGAEGEEDRDYDFLTSIEILVMDQADVFLMQNWAHWYHVLDHFHLQPKKMHGTDISRIRSWAANGWSKYYRQTLIFSSVGLPEIKAVFNRRCHNYAGKVLVENPAEEIAIEDIVVQMPHTFYRFNAASPSDSPDARFQFFTKEVLPKLRDTLMGHTLIYVPSYFEYVRLRNYFKREDINFVQICEYSKDAKIARARDMFFHTEAHFMLYSERAHFFRRFRIKGIRHIIFYQPPLYPHFYSEMCNLMQESYQNKYGGSSIYMTVSVLYCEYDIPRLKGVLGATRVDLQRSEKSEHMFVTGKR